MLVLPVPLTDIDDLSTGVECRINGNDVIVSRDENYICYGENRCQIVQESLDGDCMVFFCASHGQNADQCEVINHAPTFSISIEGTDRTLSAEELAQLLEYLADSDQLAVKEYNKQIVVELSDVLRTPDGEVIGKSSIKKAMNEIYSLIEGAECDE